MAMVELVKKTGTQLEGLQGPDGWELERDLLMIMFRLKRHQERQIEEVERWYRKIRERFDAEHSDGWDREWFGQVVDKRCAEVVAEIKARAKYK